MTTLTVSAAKARFSGIARKVISTKRPILVRARAGLVQIAPYEGDSAVAPAPKGTVKRLRREIQLGNSLGDAL